MSKKRQSLNMQRRTPSGDASELARLQAENERLTAENELLRANNPDEKAAFALWLREVYHNRGFPGVVEEAYAIRQALNMVTAANEYKTRQFEALYQEHQRAIETYTAFSEAHMGAIIRAMETQPDKTFVAAVLLICAPDMPYMVEALPVKPQEFAGDRNEAWATLFPQLIFALKGIPTPDDLGEQGKKIKGVSKDQLLRIMGRLFDPRESPDTLDERRQAEFRQLWEQLERDYPGEHDYLEVQGYFRLIVNRTKKQREKRLKAIALDVKEAEKLRQT